MLPRHYRKKIWAYLNRESFNNSVQINPLEYHSAFSTWATLFSVMDYEKSAFWMYILPIFMIVSASTAGTICFISCVHYVQIFNIHLITEIGTYLILMMYKFLITVSALTGKKHYHNLIQALRDDFHYIGTKGNKYREKFLENQRLTFKGNLLAMILTFATGIGMILCACTAAVFAVRGQTDDDKRPLPFPFWFFGYDLHASPVYETLFLSSILYIIAYTCIYSFLLQSYILWIREITCKADIITWNLQDLLVDVSPAKTQDEKIYYAALVRHRMREIVDMHHSMYNLTNGFAAVYKKCLFYEQMIAAPIICMTAYCFAEKYEEGEIQFLLLVLCIGSTMVVFSPNFLCTHLLEKVQSVSDACWDIPFWNAGPEIRPYLVLIMMKSIRPLPIVAAGFADISLKTYSNIILRAYSWFNMFRQADFNFS